MQLQPCRLHPKELMRFVLLIQTIFLDSSDHGLPKGIVENWPSLRRVVVSLKKIEKWLYLILKCIFSCFRNKKVKANRCFMPERPAVRYAFPVTPHGRTYNAQFVTIQLFDLCDTIKSFSSPHLSRNLLRIVLCTIVSVFQTEYTEPKPYLWKNAI